MNKTKKILISTILSILFTGLYYLLSSYFLNDMDPTTSYLFLPVIFIVIFITIIQILNKTYIDINSAYLIFVNLFSHVTFFIRTSPTDLTTYNNLDNIKKGYDNIEESKFLYISIKTGIILILTIIWHLLLHDSSQTSKDNKIIMILTLLTLVMLIIIPFTLSIVYLIKRNKQLKKIEVETTNKTS